MRSASARTRRASSHAVLMSPEIMWYCALPRSETNSPRASSASFDHVVQNTGHQLQTRRGLFGSRRLPTVKLTLAPGLS